jgi:hypothetical protein
MTLVERSAPEPVVDPSCDAVVPPPRPSEASAGHSATPRGNRFLSLEDLERLPDPEWLVDGFIPEHSLGMLFGQPGVGKSFVALDVALCIATGRRWQGRDVKCGAVLYVAAEGAGGMKKRVRAWRQTHRPTTEPDITFVAAPVALNDPAVVAAFRAELRSHFAGERFALVIFDTLAQCTAGADENATKDMAPAINCARAIGGDLGAAVLLVHHSTKKKGAVARGSSALVGAMDIVLLAAPADGGVRLSTEKQKDAEPARDQWFELRQVDLGTDLRGRPVNSCVIAALDEARPAAQSESAGHQRILAALRAEPEGLSATKLKALTGLAESTFHRALSELRNAGQIVKIGNARAPWRLIDQGDMPAKQEPIAA